MIGTWPTAPCSAPGTGHRAIRRSGSWAVVEPVEGGLSVALRPIRDPSRGCARCGWRDPAGPARSGGFRADAGPRRRIERGPSAESREHLADTRIFRGIDLAHGRQPTTPASRSRGGPHRSPRPRPRVALRYTTRAAARWEGRPRTRGRAVAGGGGPRDPRSASAGHIDIGCSVSSEASATTYGSASMPLPSSVGAGRPRPSSTTTRTGGGAASLCAEDPWSDVPADAALEDRDSEGRWRDRAGIAGGYAFNRGGYTELETLVAPGEATGGESTTP